jgi:hypothetical protein
MSKILELYGKTGPKTGQANRAGKDKTPIGNEFPFPGSKDLSRDNKVLEKSRNGKLNTTKYSSTVKKDR